MKYCSVFLRVLVFFSVVHTGVRADFPPAVTTFVSNYCIECHDSESEKGDRNFEPLLANSLPREHFEALKEVLDQLNLGEMPPRKNVAQPSDEERRQMVGIISAYLNKIEADKVPDATVMRRLTRYEYNYAMRDLLGVDTIAADATRLFPADANAHGFPNYGPVQALSDVQLQHYISAARTYLDRALFFGEKQPEIQSSLFKPKDLNYEKKM